MIIRTQEDWWQTVDDNWDDILEIFWKVSCILGPPDCSTDDLNKAKADRDHHKLHSMFETCWFAAPDERYIHSWAGWGELCDLCSEYWVFNPDA